MTGRSPWRQCWATGSGRWPHQRRPSLGGILRRRRLRGLRLGDPGGEAPAGACGLVRFTPDLQLNWRLLSHVQQRGAPISDRYALNAGDTGVWACYYTDWPVVRIRGDAVTRWPNTVSGAKAIALDQYRVALYGGYGPDCDRLVIRQLSAKGLQVTAEYRVALAR